MTDLAAAFTTPKGTKVSIVLDGTATLPTIMANGQTLDAHLNWTGEEVRLNDGRKACDVPASARQEVAAILKEVGRRYRAANPEPLNERLTRMMDRADSDA